MFILNRAGLEDALIAAGEQDDIVESLALALDQKSGGKNDSIRGAADGIQVDSSLFIDDFEDEDDDSDYVPGEEDFVEYSDDDALDDGK